MARTWALVDTHVGAAGDALRLRGTKHGNYVYFSIQDASSNSVVYRWNPVDGFVDVSGTTFDGLEVNSLCSFGGSLYARVLSNNFPQYTPYVYKWLGVQMWSQVWASAAPLNIGSSSGAGDLEADANRLVLYNRKDGGVCDVWASANGSSWTQQVADSGNFGDTTAPLVGLSRKTLSGYDNVLYYSDTGVWQHREGDSWVMSNDSPISVNQLVGYTDSKSWFRVGNGNTLRYSTDWGVTLNNSTGSTFGSTGSIWLSTFDNPITDHIYALLQSGDDVLIFDGGELAGTVREIWRSLDDDVFVLSGTAVAGDGQPSGDNVYLLFAIPPVPPADRRLYIFRGVRNSSGGYDWANKLVET